MDNEDYLYWIQGVRHLPGVFFKRPVRHFCIVNPVSDHCIEPMCSCGFHYRNSCFAS